MHNRYFNHKGSHGEAEPVRAESVSRTEGNFEKRN